MRLKITFSANKLTLPIAYQQVLQGIIYNVFANTEYGDFLHNEGYKIDKKIFKFFNFSNLFGNYVIKNNQIQFDGDTYFYVSSSSELFMKQVYMYFFEKKYISFYKNAVSIIGLEMENLPYFDGITSIRIRTLSPVVAYATFDNYTKYIYPKDEEFEKLCINNLHLKARFMDIDPTDILFQINDVTKIKKRVVKFKNTFYIGYMCEMDLFVNYPALSLMYNTGLSAKGSSGFGAIEIIQ